MMALEIYGVGFIMAMLVLHYENKHLLIDDQVLTLSEALATSLLSWVIPIVYLYELFMPRFNIGCKLKGFWDGLENLWRP